MSEDVKPYMGEVPETAPVTQSELTPKERTRQAIALCHNLIVNAPYSFHQNQSVGQSLQFLEQLFKTVSDGPDDMTVPAPKKRKPKSAKPAGAV